MLYCVCCVYYLIFAFLDSNKVEFWIRNNCSSSSDCLHVMFPICKMQYFFVYIFLNRKKWKRSTQNNNRSSDSQRKEHITGSKKAWKFSISIQQSSDMDRVQNEQTHFHLLQSNLSIALHTFIGTWWKYLLVCVHTVHIMYINILLFFAAWMNDGWPKREFGWTRAHDRFGSLAHSHIHHASFGVSQCALAVGTN